MLGCPGPPNFVRALRLAAAHTPVSASARNSFVRDGAAVVYEKIWSVSGGTNTPQSEKLYVYAGGRMAATKETTLPGTPVTTYTYYAVDHLGTVRYSRTLDPNGNLIANGAATYKAEPFGVMIPSVTASPNGNTHFYTGHERDTLSSNNFNQDYMHFRFYGSSMGRFFKPDSQFDGVPGNTQGWNLYTYVKSNPINFNDPTGHASTRKLRGTIKDSIDALSGGGGWSNDAQTLQKQLQEFHRRAEIPGGSTAEDGPGGGPSIGLRVPIYFDTEMYLTGEARQKEYSRITTEVLGSAVQSFGSIGIMLEFYDAGDVAISLNITERYVNVRLVSGVPFAPGSLIIVDSDQTIPVTWRGATTLTQDGLTTAIVFNVNAGPITGIHELLHAFGLGNNFSDSLVPQPNDLAALWFRTGLYIDNPEKDRMRATAFKYAIAVDAVLRLPY